MGVSTCSRGYIHLHVPEKMWRSVSDHALMYDLCIHPSQLPVSPAHCNSHVLLTSSASWGVRRSCAPCESCRASDGTSLLGDEVVAPLQEESVQIVHKQEHMTTVAINTRPGNLGMCL